MAGGRRIDSVGGGKEDEHTFSRESSLLLAANWLRCSFLCFACGLRPPPLSSFAPACSLLVLPCERAALQPCLRSATTGLRYATLMWLVLGLLHHGLACLCRFYPLWCSPCYFVQCYSAAQERVHALFAAIARYGVLDALLFSLISPLSPPTCTVLIHPD
ncbi:hypothetical protein L7F22_013454 [Adiantum nelumboides]|nr:hypothetical protein [Adiantum nelumboides]